MLGNGGYGNLWADPREFRCQGLALWWFSSLYNEGVAFWARLGDILRNVIECV